MRNNSNTLRFNSLQTERKTIGQIQIYCGENIYHRPDKTHAALPEVRDQFIVT